MTDILPASVLLWAGRILPVILGAGAGYAWYRFIGCRSGSCPITSNRWISMIYGALIGSTFIR